MHHWPLSSLRQASRARLAKKVVTSSFTAFLSGPAVAQTVADAASSPGSDTGDPAAAAGTVPTPGATHAGPADSLDLERVVVTATAVAQSRLKGARSVTTIDDDLVRALNPQTRSEVLRLIPGMIDQGGNGPGGNANITTVRGLPVITGGSPFVQMQEDGLPTVLFGNAVHCSQPPEW